MTGYLRPCFHSKDTHKSDPKYRNSHKPQNYFFASINFSLEMKDLLH